MVQTDLFVKSEVPLGAAVVHHQTIKAAKMMKLIQDISSVSQKQERKKLYHFWKENRQSTGILAYIASYGDWTLQIK